MEYRRYEKVHRIGKDEVQGILEGVCYIEEKLDGANASIWLDSEMNIATGSRNRDLKGYEFNGFTPYAKGHAGIIKLLTDHPGYRLYGEWLVRHTLHYQETAYKKFYLFDIHSPNEGNEGKGRFLSPEEVHAIAEEYQIEVVPLITRLENPKAEDLEKYIGASMYGEKAEGIIIKNPAFINAFGDRTVGKIVSQEFKEDNGVTFGGNNKHSDTYNEMYIVNKYMTLARVEKIMHKIQPLIEEKLSEKHTARVIHTAYHDMLTEEIWEIATSKVSGVDFKALARISQKKAAQIFHDILRGTISVADLKHEKTQPTTTESAESGEAETA